MEKSLWVSIVNIFLCKRATLFSTVSSAHPEKKTIAAAKSKIAETNLILCITVFYIKYYLLKIYYHLLTSIY